MDPLKKQLVSNSEQDAVQGTPSQRPPAFHVSATLHVMTLSPHELKARVAQARGLVQQQSALLLGLRSLPDAERVRLGAFLREGEDGAIASVLDAAAVRPELCAVLVKQDGAAPASNFDVEALRADMAKAAELDALAALHAAVAQQCSDTALVLKGRVRGVASEAYELLRPASRHDPNVLTALKPAIDFYAKIGRKGARTRAANAAAAEKTAEPGDPQ